MYIVLGKCKYSETVVDQVHKECAVELREMAMSAQRRFVEVTAELEALRKELEDMKRVEEVRVWYSGVSTEYAR